MEKEIDQKLQISSEPRKDAEPLSPTSKVKSMAANFEKGKTENEQVPLHISQTSSSYGFGGKYGVQTDRVDACAEGYKYKAELEPHSSTKTWTLTDIPQNCTAEIKALLEKLFAEKSIEIKKVFEKQEKLETQHRKAEDSMYESFQKSRQEDIRKLEDELKREMEKELAELTKNSQIDEKTKEELARQFSLKRKEKMEVLKKLWKQREFSKTTDLHNKQIEEMLRLFHGVDSEQTDDKTIDTKILTNEMPEPFPPTSKKHEIYTDSSFFEQIDQIAINVAQSDYTNFSSLIRIFTIGARSEIDIARAIFRWIAIKNLDVIEFDASVDGDSPMGLLRGIKYGTETYATLFKRMCSYAGLYCLVLTGYSKGVGYRSGQQFQTSQFNNSWNVVFVDGSWRFVQVHWGARHITGKKDDAKSRENLIYKYNDYYFMPDPEEFIYQFFPKEEKWQLLDNSITLEQFENLPKICSDFFKFQLSFTDPKTPAILHANNDGIVEFSITVKPDIENNIDFSKQLTFYNNNKNDFNGVELNRYAMHYRQEDKVTFRLFIPTSEPLSLSIYAIKYPTKTEPPLVLDEMCEFKIVCENPPSSIQPLPGGSIGEWGPSKTKELFDLIPLSHTNAIITCAKTCEIRFLSLKSSIVLDAYLQQNDTNDEQLKSCCQIKTEEKEKIIKIDFPEKGQYGLDIYVGDKEKAEGTTIHLKYCCKYLINVFE